MSDNGAVKIESGIPIPDRKNKRKWPLGDLEVGQSFAAPLCKRGSIGNLVSALHPKKFTVRVISDTEIRVWRIK